MSHEGCAASEWMVRVSDEWSMSAWYGIETDYGQTYATLTPVIATACMTAYDALGPPPTRQDRYTRRRVPQQS